MKIIISQAIILFTLLFTLNSCKKNEVIIPYSESLSQKVIHKLKDSLSTNDFAKLDSTKINVYKLNSDNRLLQILTSESLKFILVEADINGNIIKGNILHFDTSFVSIATNNNGCTFNGTVNVSYLNGHQVSKSIIENGYIIRSNSSSIIKSNSVSDHIKPFDNSPHTTLPDVVVSTIINSKGNAITNSYYWNLFNFLAISSYQNQYIPIDPSYFGYSSPYTVNLIDDKKPAIDLFSFINCFETISGVGAKYSLSIASLLPVDNHPDQLINMYTQSAGHAFITLKKENSSGQSITQVIGFYPTELNFYTLAGSVGSKIANDEENKYSAKYTIEVTENQFRSAINKAINLSYNPYNLYDFNCTNYAIAVFNASGGNLYVDPQLYMPYSMGAFYSAYPVYNPNALYRSIEKKQQSGNNSAIINTSKADKSHGPCY